MMLLLLIMELWWRCGYYWFLTYLLCLCSSCEGIGNIEGGESSSNNGLIASVEPIEQVFGDFELNILKAWMYTVLIDEDIIGISSRQILQQLDKMKIQTRPLWCPMHMLPVYKNVQSYHIEYAEKIYKEALSLPCSIGLDIPSQEKVLNAILELIR